MTHKYYDLLGINQNASQDDIKKAYKKAAIANHPDKGGDPEKFKEIANAYQVLSDENKRRDYDHLGDDMFKENAQSGGGGGGMHPFGGMNPHDIFANLFGGGGFPGGGFPFDMHMNGGHGGGGNHVKRNDHLHNLTISLHEAFFGSKKSIKINITKTCLSCKTECGACQGRGQIQQMLRTGPFTQVFHQQCNSCSGSGQTLKSNPSCPECNGSMKIQKYHKLDFEIPKGVQSGYQQTFKGFGEQKQNRNDIAGDLIVKITISDDSTYQRRGNDLIYNSSITFKESIIGKKITLSYFGEILDIDLKKFTVIQPSTEYIIKGKGMPIENRPGAFGNMILIFGIKYPSLADKNNDVSEIVQALSKFGID